MKLCIGYAPTRSQPRYQVVDDVGPLRVFWSKEEALKWMQPNMTVVVLPKPKREKLFIECEEAPW
jgi:hypothetical protein